MEHPQENAGSDNDIVTEKTFNKGPWTREEDDLLKAYVDQHGAGNWNAVHKTSNLSRDGKSCRLRWMNHLRPNLKKSGFTYEEEQRVIELQAVWGNKWAKMATELPGRTDNEIKNFWNTRLKRLQRQGLPVHPDEVREKMMNAASDAHNNQDSLEEDEDDLPKLDFKDLSSSKYASYYQAMVRSVAQLPDQMFGNAMNYSPYMSCSFTGGDAMNEQSLPLEDPPFVESYLAPVQDIQMRDNATFYSPSEPPMYMSFTPPNLNNKL